MRTVRATIVTSRLLPTAIMGPNQVSASAAQPVKKPTWLARGAAGQAVGGAAVLERLLNLVEADLKYGSPDVSVGGVSG
jgi:hypothetical protein